MDDLDFWNIDKERKERIPLDIINTKEFQVKFIVDLLNDSPSIVSRESIETHRQNDIYTSDMTILKVFNIEYSYEKILIPIDIVVVTDEGKNDFNLKFSTIENKDIDFGWIDKNIALEKKVLNSLI